MKKLILIISLVLAVSALLAGCSQPAATVTPAPAPTTDVIFTKWVTTAGTAPVVMNMAGVVSGDAGAGLYTGEVLEYKPGDAITTVVADYHINGGIHQLTAHLNVTQDNKKGTAVLTGTVTAGWLKGAQVNGTYQVIGPSGILNAQQGVGGDYAYQGTLHIQSR